MNRNKSKLVGVLRQAIEIFNEFFRSYLRKLLKKKVKFSIFAFQFLRIWIAVVSIMDFRHERFILSIQLSSILRGS